MGLGLSARAAIPRQGLLRRPAKPNVLIAQVAKALAAAMDDEICRRWSSISFGEEPPRCLLHPLAEQVDLEVDCGYLHIMAKTSTVGPGYHAKLVHAIDTLKASCGLQIEWSWEEDGEVIQGDDTGYAAHRDFGKLQASFVELLASLAGIVIEHGDPDSQMKLNWSIGGDPLPQVAGFSINMAGVFSREWWLGVQQSGGTPSDARCFFEWWSFERSEEDWEYFGRSVMWSMLRWHPPADDANRVLTELVILAGERSSLGSQFPDEMRELRNLLDTAPEDASPPREDGFGLLRQDAIFHGPGGITIKAPGYFYSMQTEDGTTVLLFPGVEIHLSALTRAETDDASDESSPEESLAETPGELVEFAQKELRGKAEFKPPDDEGFHVMNGIALLPPHAAIVTIVFGEGVLQDGVLDIFRTLTINPPRSRAR